MMFDRPGLILLVSLATLGPLAGLAVVRFMNDYKTPTGWDAWFSFITLAAIDLLNGLVISAWVAQMYDEYKKLSDRDGARPLRTESNPVKPPIFVDGKKLIHAFTMPQLKVNVEMLFARALIAQSRGNFDVDLTEEYWIKSGRWVKLGGVGALDFRETLARWKDSGAIGRKNPNAKNSKYIVTDREMIVRVAAGEKI